MDGENGDWRVRVVPNKFPALNDEPHSRREKVFGLVERMNGTGSHEVVIDSPSHATELPDRPAEQTEAILATYVARLHALAKDKDHHPLLLFKNHGKAAGARPSTLPPWDRPSARRSPAR